MDIWIIIPIILLFVLFFLKVPVAYAMLISTLVYFSTNPNTMPTEMIVQRLISSHESFTYLAIPFFACAGIVFNYSGITKKLMNLADLVLGHFVGGLGHVNIVLSALMGGLSGSANADAAMQSKMLVPEMEKRGYSREYSSVVTAASSCITPIIPPGIILILYATASNVSIEKMFYAGYLPGFIIMSALLVLNYIISKKRGYKPTREEKPTGKQISQAVIGAIPALFMPFGIIMGLRLGVFTPTEAGAICVVYAIFVGKFVYKELKFSDIGNIIRESVAATAGVMFIIAAANALGMFLTWEKIPMILSSELISNIRSPLVLLLVINILLIIVGCFFEGGAAMVLLAPLLVPVVSEMGIDLVHFGIIMCINLTIAGFTPPFGAMMFVTTSITGVKVEKFAKEAIPFITVLIGILLLLTYLPGIVMCVPNLLG